MHPSNMYVTGNEQQRVNMGENERSDNQHGWMLMREMRRMKMTKLIFPSQLENIIYIASHVHSNNIRTSFIVPVSRDGWTTCASLTLAEKYIHGECHYRNNPILQITWERPKIRYTVYRLISPPNIKWWLTYK